MRRAVLVDYPSWKQFEPATTDAKRRERERSKGGGRGFPLLRRGEEGGGGRAHIHAEQHSVCLEYTTSTPTTPHSSLPSLYSVQCTVYEERRGGNTNRTFHTHKTKGRGEKCLSVQVQCQVSVTLTHVN